MIALKQILIIFTLIICVISSYLNVSFAAENCNEIQDEWNPISAGPITTWSSPLCGQGKIVIQPFFFYNRTRGTFNGEGHYKSFKNKDTKSQYQQQFFLQYGITDRLELDGQAVYQENLRHKDGGSAEAHGFGDSYLFLRYCAIEEKHWLPHITGLVQLKLPTGKYQKLDEGKLETDSMGATTGGGSYDHGYGINFTKKIRPFILHADFIYSFPIETKIDGVKTRYANYVNYDFGIEYFLLKGFNLMVECNGLIQGDKKSDGEFIPASDIRSFNISSGIGWSCDKIQTLLAYQRTLTGTNIDVNDSIIFTFVYTF